MMDQGFENKRQLVEERSRVTVRVVPLGPKALTGASATFATVPPKQMMKVGKLAVCNPTAAAVTLTLTVTPSGGSALTQISALSVAANSQVDLTAMIGGLYQAGATLAAVGNGLILSGWYEAVL